jgi:hypothetical protein
MYLRSKNDEISYALAAVQIQGPIHTVWACSS